MIGVYKIVSPTGRIYVGQSKDIQRRFSEYNKLKCIKQRKLYSSLKKYGVDAHIFTILEECEEDLLNIVERKWQDYYDVTGKNGLNLCLVNTEDKRRVFTEESISIMKNKLSKLFLGESGPFYGRKHTNESRAKMSMNRIGNKNAIGGKRHLGPLSAKATIILDLDNGIFYSIGELSNNLGISIYKLRLQLNKSKKYIIV